MRVIGTLDNEQKALIFSSFLNSKGIKHEIEIDKQMDWGNSTYGTVKALVWIEDEEQVNDANNWLKLFNHHPSDPIFSQATPLLFNHIQKEEIISEETPQQIAWERQPLGLITRLIITLCCLLFIGVQVTTHQKDLPKQLASWSAFTSPIEQTLLYDFPKFYELIDELLIRYQMSGETSLAAFERSNQPFIKELNQTPMWQGIYKTLIKGGIEGTAKTMHEVPLFEKIRQGEVWRLITPVLLHGDIFHIFFNMIWLLVLGKQLEQRLKPLRYILFMLIVGILSNTAQYLMSGPNFVGFSGILCGMLAFIWIRQRKYPWEGYQIDSMTMGFMFIFIFGMAGLQLLSFWIEQFFAIPISPNIANTAHIAGGFVGLLLGLVNYFSWRHA